MDSTGEIKEEKEGGKEGKGNERGFPCASHKLLHLKIIIKWISKY